MYTDPIFDLILLMAKYYIYSLKWSESLPNIRTFHAIVKNRYKFEKYASMCYNQSIKFNNLWYPYANLIS